MEPALVVCSSKVHALGKLLNHELAEHILRYAVGGQVQPEAAPGALPDCSKCRGPAIVDMSDRRVRRAWHFCLRERRVQMEQKLARDLANLERDGRLTPTDAGHTGGAKRGAQRACFQRCSLGVARLGVARLGVARSALLILSCCRLRSARAKAGLAHSQKDQLSHGALCHFRLWLKRPEPCIACNFALLASERQRPDNIP